MSHFFILTDKRQHRRQLGTLVLRGEAPVVADGSQAEAVVM
jgi:hypothetical protein